MKFVAIVTFVAIVAIVAIVDSRRRGEEVGHQLEVLLLLQVQYCCTCFSTRFSYRFGIDIGIGIGPTRLWLFVRSSPFDNREQVEVVCILPRGSLVLQTGVQLPLFSLVCLFSSEWKLVFGV